MRITSTVSRHLTAAAFALAAAAPLHAQTAAQKMPQPSAAPKAPAWLDAYREPASRLIGAAMTDTFAWRRLATLTDTIGNRQIGRAHV